MVNVHEEEQRTVSLLLDSLRDKIDSGRYDDTAILVFASAFWPVGIDARADLVRRTRVGFLERQSSIPAVDYCFWPDYSIVPVER